MPQPTSTDVHVNRPLTNVSIAYMQDQKDFIADKVFPNVPVTKKSDSYFVYPKDQWFRTDAQKRAPSSESAGSGYTVTTDTYSAEVQALHKDVDDQVRGNADAPFNLDSDATEFVSRGLLAQGERFRFEVHDDERVDGSGGLHAKSFVGRDERNADQKHPDQDGRHQGQDRIQAEHAGTVGRRLVRDPGFG